MIAAALQTLEGQEESRRQPRRRLSLNVATRAGKGPIQEVLIHDISSGGLLLESKAELAKDEPITVDLPDSHAATARVMWNSGRFYGCQFDRPIPTSIVSAALLRSPFERAIARPDIPAGEADVIADSGEIPYSVERGSLASGARIHIILFAALVLWAAIFAVIGIV